MQEKDSARAEKAGPGGKNAASAGAKQSGGKKPGRFFSLGLHYPDFSHLHYHFRFALLLITTALLTTALSLAQFPAALLIGPMICAILLSIGNISLRVPPLYFVGAQGGIGCMLGSYITPAILHEALRDWPIFLSGVVSVIIAATFIGYFLARKQLVPGSTAIWGAAAGGAEAMVLMADSFGADVRIVAIMQYMRVIFVSLSAAILAHILMPGHSAAPHQVLFPAFSPIGLLITLFIAFGGSFTARYILHIPSGGMLFPFIITIILQGFNIFSPVLPLWLLAIFYVLIGWNIGLRFTRTILLHALKLMPILIASTLSLMVICVVFAFGLSYFAGVDLLTAYLATSPGGADSVSIIAAGINVNQAFVMAYQSTRLLLVALTGPTIASAVARHLNRLLPPRPKPKIRK